MSDCLVEHVDMPVVLSRLMQECHTAYFRAARGNNLSRRSLNVYVYKFRAGKRKYLFVIWRGTNIVAGAKVTGSYNRVCQESVDALLTHKRK